MGQLMSIPFKMMTSGNKSKYVNLTYLNYSEKGLYILSLIKKRAIGLLF